MGRETTIGRTTFSMTQTGSRSVGIPRMAATRGICQLQSPANSAVYLLLSYAKATSMAWSFVFLKQYKRGEQHGKTAMGCAGSGSGNDRGGPGRGGRSQPGTGWQRAASTGAGRR